MSMKKAFDQTIRDIKREVNKKVLKVPSIEQKVLDATSNEPWGPHGSLLADIAQATRNYHEYQMIMSILWKRINDTGKNWRHVYKALTVLEYLVAHGSERVIDDIREHAYQISTLSDFQYIDSSGRDQGNNVRRKSQSLVVLVNDKERIHEVREKAASNRDKFRTSSAAGGMYRPGSGGYGDERYEGRYGGRDDDRNENGRERDWGNRDDERYGRYGDSYGREGDRYGRDSEDHYGRDSYRDGDSRGRSRSVDDYGSRGRSSDRDRDRAYDEDDHRSSRGSSVRAEDHPSDGRHLERKFSEQNLGAPPSYEEAVGASRSPTYSERDGEAPVAPAPQMSSPTTGATAQLPSSVANAVPSSAPVANATQSPLPDTISTSQSPVEHGVSTHSNMPTDVFDEFDPRGSISAAPRSPNHAEMDLLGSLSDAFSPGPLAIMPASSEAVEFDADASITASNPKFGAATFENNSVNQSFEDPFGDSPFKAIPSDEPANPQNFGSTTSFQPAVNTLERAQSGPSNLEFAGAFPGSAYHSANTSNVQRPPNQEFFPEEQQLLHNDDILAGILPPGQPAIMAPQATFPATTIPGPATASQAAFQASTGQPPAGFGFMPQSGPAGASYPHMASQNMVAPSGQVTQQNSYSQQNSFHGPSGMTSHQNNDFLGGLLQQANPAVPSSSQAAPSTSVGPLTLVPQQPAEKKFETKSSVWADTLNRGLVNLNISGSKINPLSDIGIDFESLNRKEKRMEKPTTAPPTSSISMGKAMGSGTGMGRAGAGALRPQNQMMGSGMGMGMGGMGMAGAAPVGMGTGNYSPMNQQPMGMGMGMAMGMGGMGMNMGMGRGAMMQPPMGQGMLMQPPNALPPGSNMNNNNPMMGRGGYPPQQPYQYGGGYR